MATPRVHSLSPQASLPIELYARSPVARRRCCALPRCGIRCDRGLSPGRTRRLRVVGRYRALAADGPRLLRPTLLWASASVFLVAAGFALLGVRHIERYWRAFAAIGLLASLALLGLYRPRTALAGVLIDVALLGLVLWLPVPPRFRQAADGNSRWRLAARWAPLRSSCISPR